MTTPFKIGIVGSRDYPDLNHVRAYVYELAKKNRPIVIVSGGARGVDEMAERTAKECGLETLIFLPDKKYGFPAALFERNTQIVNASDMITAFWDGLSTGTMDTMKKANKARKRVYVKQPYMGVVS